MNVNIVCERKLTGRRGTIIEIKHYPERYRIMWEGGGIAWYPAAAIYAVDWTKPIELDDGTPLTVGSIADHTVSISVSYANRHHPAFHGACNSFARTAGGLVGSNHKYRVRNRIMKNVDTSKPLQIVATNATTRDMKFVTRTEEHHILVMPAKASDASFNWAIFTSEGDFVSSSDTSGKALKLRNKAVVTTETVDIHLLQGVAKVEITCTDGTPTSARLV